MPAFRVRNTQPFSQACGLFRDAEWTLLARSLPSYSTLAKCQQAHHTCKPHTCAHTLTHIPDYHNLTRGIIITANSQARPWKNREVHRRAWLSDLSCGHPTKLFLPPFLTKWLL